MLKILTNIANERMKIHVLLAAVAVSLCLSCRTKQTVEDVKIGALSAQFEKGSSRLLMNDIIAWFDISVSDSDTTYTPKAMAKRCLSLQQEDSVYIHTSNKTESKKVSTHEVNTTSRDVITHLQLLVIIISILILLLLFIFFLWKR
jgi:hypothetical protein